MLRTLAACTRRSRLSIPHLGLSLPPACARLTEIEQRQKLRAECKLPPLDRTYELARLRRLLEMERKLTFDAW